MYSAFEQALSMKRVLYKFGIIIIIIEHHQCINSRNSSIDHYHLADPILEKDSKSERKKFLSMGLCFLYQYMN